MKTPAIQAAPVPSATLSEFIATFAVVLAAILAVIWLASVVHTLAAVRRQSRSRQLPSLQRTGRQG